MSATSAKVAVVTGAGSGLGRAIARRLAGAGYVVALAGRRMETLEATQSELPASPGSFAVPTDVSDPASVEALFAEVVRDAGRVDLLVNNAGTFGPSAPVGEYPPDGWASTIATNLTGAFLCARAAFRADGSPEPERRADHQQRLDFGPRPASERVAYTASKHGITGLTKALALEGRALGIACGQIDIGNAATEMTRQIESGALQADGQIRPEPTMSAEHVADAVLYMAGLPLEANVLTMTVMASGMPFVGRG